MAGDGNKVAVIVSPEAAPDIARLAQECPVWAIRTPETEGVSGQARRSGGDVTLFIADEDAETSVLSIIGELELHHGAVSQDPPFAVVEVLGVVPTDAIRAELKLLGFSRLDASPSGFVAKRD